MTDIIDKLMHLGLSQYEAKTYLALLRAHPAKPYQLSKTAGVPAAKIYEVVKRLEERGLMVKIAGTGQGYVPKNPELALNEWRDQYLRTLQEAEQELKAAMEERPLHVVWNIEGRDQVVAQGERLLARSERTISLASSASLVDAWAQALSQARERGVSLRLISYGQPDSEFEGLNVQVLEFSEFRKDPRPGTALAVDRRMALFAAADGRGGILEGAWTENPAIAAIAEEYVADKLFLERAIADRRFSLGVETE